MKYFVLFLALIVFVAIPASAQRRDYMTDPEIELIRDNQDIDKRIDVLTKMIDRRFSAMGIEVGGWKQSGLGREGSHHGIEEFLEMLGTTLLWVAVLGHFMSRFPSWRLEFKAAV